jgi:protocatechuate 3,4-dioxygenase beta subunit
MNRRRARLALVLAVAFIASGAALLAYLRRDAPPSDAAAGLAARAAGGGDSTGGAGFGPGAAGPASGAATAARGAVSAPAPGAAAASISGTILDPDGKPLAGAAVRARLETAKKGGVGATTLAGGGYTITPLEGGVYQIEARAPGLRVETLGGIVLHAGEQLRGVDFVLDRGERVLGTVLTPEGHPAPNATVAARPAGGKREAEPEASATTGKDGAFEMSGLTVGKKELVASAEGYRRSEAVVVEITPRAAARVELKLRTGAFIAGRVTDAKGAPAAGARVTAAPEGGGGPFGGGRLDGGGEATTGDDGRYRVDGLAGRRFRVTAYPPESAAATLAQAAKGGVKPNAEDCDLQLGAVASIEGVVLRAGARTPIEGASVAISDRGFSTSATTDSSGAFLLSGIPAGDWTAKASAADKAPVEQKVSLAQGEKKAGVVFELAEGGVIDGTVVAARDGHPLEGAIVRVIAGGGGGAGAGAGPGPGRRSGPGEEMLVEATAGGADFSGFMPADQLEELLARNNVTDSRGHFHVTGLGVGEQRVYAAHADYPGAAAATKIESPGDAKQVVIALPDGGGLAGHVADANGAPQPDEAVIAFSFAGRVRTGKTNDGGDYEIHGLAPGSYFVSLGVEMRARFGGGGAARVDPQAQSMGFTAKTASIEAGRVTRVDFGAEPHALVSGRVLRAEQPVPDESVQFFPDGGALGLRGAQTDQNGVYSVDLAAGSYVIRVENVSENFDVPPGIPEMTHDIRLPQGALSGRVVNAATSEPVRADVQLYKAQRQAADSLVSVLGALAGDTRSSDQDGTFRMSGLAPGLFTITARADGFATGRVDGIEVPPDGEAGGIEIALEPGGVFRGHVTDDAGNALPGASIWIVEMTATDLGSGNPPRADDQGNFEIKRFAPGKYRVTVLDETHAPWRQIVDFPGGTLDLAPILLPGGTLEIAVVDGGGRPLAGAAVDLRYPEGDRVITSFIDFVQPSMPTGPDGKLRRPRLPPGPLVGVVTVPSASPPRTATFQAVVVNKSETSAAARVP